MIRRLALMTLAIGIVVGGSLPASGAIITKLAVYTTPPGPGPLPIVDFSSDTRGLLVLASDFPLGELVGNVIVEIDLTKSAETINPDGTPVGGGNAFHAEVILRLISPESTVVSLVEQNTYSGAVGGVRRTVEFDDSAATTVGGGAIFNGTYMPVGSLSDFIGESPAGDWRLYFEDTGGGPGNPSPLSVNAWTLSIETSPVPEPSALAIWLILVAVGSAIGCCRRWK
ncbi:MAG: hypothetical protein A2V70_21210 [Planctomycetes bacterium RBG_13_63_9]|nr:MAG: hypothetical protein A2V70_21210 [Planctomycetes bacterium RBG_13_63_9]